MMKKINISLAFAVFLLAGSIRLVAQQNGPAKPDDTVAVVMALPEAPAPKTKTDTAGTEKPAAQTEPYELRDRFNDYLQSTFGPTALIFPAVAAGYGQWNNRPPEWQQGPVAYAKRLGSAYGSTVLDNTISFGIAALDREDLRYVRSTYPKTAILKRTGYAIKHTFISPRDGGGNLFAFSRIAGAYGGGFIANTWYPDGHSSMHNAAYLGTFNFAADLGSNILREFIRLHWIWGPEKDKKTP